MLPLLTGLISGGASLLGNIFSSDTSAQNTQANIAAQEMMQGQTQQFNAQQAELNRQFQSSQVSQQEAFQQQMSGSAYQRASQDMTAAGLNPMMMFGSGGPASVPSGSAASGSTASVGTPNMALSNRQSGFGQLGDVVSKTVNSAIAAKTYDKMTEETANLITERERTQAAADLLRAEKPTEEQRAVREGNLASLTGLQLPAARVSAKEAQGVEGMGDTFLRAAGIGKYAGQSISDIMAPFVSSSRIAQGFSALKSDALKRDIDKGNFIGKYGVPIDEYLKP